jgi:hypothetical protein
MGITDPRFHYVDELFKDSSGVYFHLMIPCLGIGDGEETA